LLIREARKKRSLDHTVIMRCCCRLRLLRRLLACRMAPGPQQRRFWQRRAGAAPTETLALIPRNSSSRDSSSSSSSSSSRRRSSPSSRQTVGTTGSGPCAARHSRRRRPITRPRSANTCWRSACARRRAVALPYFAFAVVPWTRIAARAGVWFASHRGCHHLRDGTKPTQRLAVQAADDALEARSRLQDMRATVQYSRQPVIAAADFAAGEESTEVHVQRQASSSSHSLRLGCCFDTTCRLCGPSCAVFSKHTVRGRASRLTQCGLTLRMLHPAASDNS